MPPLNRSIRSSKFQAVKFAAVRRLRLGFPAIATQRAKLNSTTPAATGALFIAPDAAGSLGDSAMMHAGIGQLKRQGLEKFGVIYPSYGADTPDWSHVPGISTHLGVRYKPEDYWHEARSALGRYWQDLERFVALVRQHGQVYCVGADVMDGYYSLEICQFLTDLLGLAATAGAQTTLVGFSFNKNPKPEAVRLLQRLPQSVRFCSRDPQSRQRAEQFLGRSVHLVADAAFLLEPTQSTPQVRQLLGWMATQRSQNRRLIGINTNAMLLRAVEGLTVEKFVAHYAQTLARLFEHHRDLSFVMLPHDDRYEVHDVLLAKKVLEQLPEAVRDRSALLELPCAPGDVKRVCQGLDLVSTSRMHVAIAALGQGTPTLSIGYQDKHEGLYQHFEAPQLLTTPELAFEPDGLLNLIETHLPNAGKLRQHLEARLPDVMALAQQNFV